MTTGRINQVTFSFDQDEKGIAPPHTWHYLTHQQNELLTSQVKSVLLNIFSPV